MVNTRNFVYSQLKITRTILYTNLLTWDQLETNDNDTTRQMGFVDDVMNVVT